MKMLLGILVLGLLSIILVSCNEKNTKIKIEKVLLFASLRARPSVFLSIAASVAMKASIVAIFGWIIPDPLAMPPIVILSFPM